MSKIQSTNVPGKETIYVDVDDEITGIIDKVQSSKGKVVALVLPKRATVLQSVVNMKLLKRTADEASKHLVLITSEAGLLPLAGSVGLHVASTPTSKPAIPPVPVGPGDETEDVDEPFDMADDTPEETAADYDPAAAAAVPVGELAGAGAASKIKPADVDEAIELGDEDKPEVAVTSTKKPKKNKKLSVPNFDSFRKKLLLGGGVLVLLIALWIVAFMVLPKATVTIHTDTSTITSNLNLTLDTTAKALDAANKVVPAVAQSDQKSATQQVAATGQQNNGAKATGSITMSAGPCAGDVPASIAAGTSVAANSHTYILNSSVSFAPTISHGKCTFTGVDNSGSNNISIVALKGGADYNISSANFSVSSRTDVSASGSASGGTDNITKIVSQSDIDSAKAKIVALDTSAIKQGLASVLQGKGLQAVQTTFLAGDPQVTTSAQAGDAADTVTVTEVTTYTMLGVKQVDLKNLVDANVTGQLDKGKQVILDDGVSNAKFSQQNPATTTSAAVSMQTKSVAGPQLDIAQLKTQIAGKKSGDIKSLIQQTPGVTSVDVKYSPFWVTATPKSTAKITIQLDKARGSNQ